MAAQGMQWDGDGLEGAFYVANAGALPFFFFGQLPRIPGCAGDGKFGFSTPHGPKIRRALSLSAEHDPGMHTPACSRVSYHLLSPWT
jgi:hypothetical protein